MPKINLFQNRILVKERIYEEKTKGGIALPFDVVDKGQYGQCEGEIVHLGATAFDYIEEDERPKIGTIVLNPDDFDDSATTNKFVNAGEKADIATIDALASQQTVNTNQISTNTTNRLTGVL